ncbi:MAG: methylated-DNA--[protein]-cysteine S-methyltransferase [Microbacteriaceae bacterium]|nr:methylated-DNA--[protein]-cysteine S-methyltransferase [Microbacteriaceae bacterium]
MTEFDSIIRTDSPIGRLEITARAGAIVGLDIESDGRLPRENVPEHKSPALAKAATQLAQYFAGKRRTFDVPVNLAGTPFQLSVWDALAEIPYGEFRSYGDVGTSTGRATAGRAVGGAVGANPIPIIVPCHRVLAHDGRITGYSGGNGIPTKVWLLDHEGIPHR